MEGDLLRNCHSNTPMVFQSTPSAWRETPGISRYLLVPRHFNPLPPHGGRLDFIGVSGAHTNHFNPLPPHGGRPVFVPANKNSSVFQSTPSAWRETGNSTPPLTFSLHFNPLPPHGGRPVVVGLCPDFERISIHSLRMEGDISDMIDWDGDETFQSTPSAWRETRETLHVINDYILFQSTPSAWRETCPVCGSHRLFLIFQSTPSAWRETVHNV